MLSRNLKQWVYAVALVAVANIHDVSVQAQETSNRCKERKMAGLYCETCELLATCVQNGENDWMSIPVLPCPEGLVCDAKHANCSNIASSPCLGGDVDSLFACNSIGIFPDPFDCQVYRICYYDAGMLLSGKVDCANGMAFDAAVGQCKLSTSDPVCLEPQYNCTQPGNMQPWPSNPNYYYVCKTATSEVNSFSYPEMYRCSDGYIFKDNSCIPEGNTNGGNGSGGNRPGTGGSGDTSGDDDAGTLECTKLGLNPDPSNCHKYYQCNTIGGPPKHYSCTAGTYYHPETGACRFGEC